jgi:hypothetical protein
LRRIITIGLLCCLFAPITGTYLYLKHEKKLIKREIKAHLLTGIDKKECIQLTFKLSDSQSKLRWEHAKEFEWNGQMFDVLHKKVIGDSIQYTCWWDNKEGQLNKKLTELVSNFIGNHAQNKENNKRLYHYFKSLYCERIVTNFNLSFKLVKIQYHENQVLVKSMGNKPNIPPPKSFSITTLIYFC